MSILQRFALAVVASFVLAAPLATAGHAGHRVALVIGNDQYQNLSKLQKAAADAGAYAEVLKAKGFDQVILKTNLSRGQMDEAIAMFIDQVQPGDTAVFAYSGHGWSDGAQNYIVGTDASGSGSQELLARISIPLKNGLNGIIDEMDQKGATLKVAIIDACRDNPFTPLPGKKGVGLSRGMVRIDPPHGTFVVFSAGEGQSALDGLSNEKDRDPDPNSVFTRVFVPAIRADRTLQDAIKTTQEEVVALAKTIHEDQEPAYYDGVIGTACLSAKCKAGVAPPEDNTETVFWQTIQNSKSIEDFQAYLEKFPSGMFAQLARNRLAALKSALSDKTPPDEIAWQGLLASTDPVAIESFARLFPNSTHKAEADAKAKSLRAKIWQEVPMQKPIRDGSGIPGCSARPCESAYAEGFVEKPETKNAVKSVVPTACTRRPCPEAFQ